jgi:uncharacterized protein (TIGR00156 family)
MAKHRFITSVSVALALGSVATASLAQYVATGKFAPAHTVSEVLKDPVDDRRVELTGMLVQQTGRETFLFRDATGEIRVEIDAEDFPANQPIDASTRVLIHGEVEKKLTRKPVIDVERVQLAPAS